MGGFFKQIIDSVDFGDDSRQAFQRPCAKTSAVRNCRHHDLQAGGVVEIKNII